ncbi:ABC transporter substrate-binding protein [Frankia sp. Ag45/Mut15]|uniref:ABC transporter substrate-binding protein n=1 Tax=Frankia umida TaxID=573489 RepID=A0ABT0JZB4_9ACTN|nr:ABC transporter substrate-binding protein [Frankia umida]MCK9876904.1 ABC transporter substrate-binding protein [Frankia umida]
MPDITARRAGVTRSAVRRRRRPAGRGGRWARAALACLSAVSGLVACTSTSSTVTPAAACAGPGISRDAIRLGLIYPDTGITASLFATFRDGVDARLGVANAAGGVNGRQITYTWRDDASSPAGNQAAAHSLVDNDAVFGLIESSLSAGASADLLHRAGIPVTGTSLDPDWAGHDNMFSYSNLVARGSSVTTWGRFVADQGGHRAVLIQSAFSQTSMVLADEMERSLRAAGIPVVDRVDATSLIAVAALGEKVRASGADVMIGTVTGAAFASLLRATRGKPSKLRVILSPTNYDQGLLERYRDALPDVYTFTDYQPFELNLPAHRRFLAGMRAYAPQVTPPTQQAALAGWISADMFLRGLVAAGPCPSRALFLHGLRALRGYTADGLLPAAVDFATSTAQVSQCYTFLRVNHAATGFEVLPPAPRCGQTIAR